MRPVFALCLLGGLALGGACANKGAPGSATAASSAPSIATAAPTEPSALPPYLERLARDGDLYARDGGAIVAAPDADIAVLRSYPSFRDKGPLGARGERLTLLTAKTRYAPGEEVRVIHVHEATRPGVELYVMGPKAIYGEYVDGKLTSPAAAAPPAPYDGAVLKSPGVDHNYEVSVYHLAAGTHTIQWRFATLSGPEVLASNVLRIEVR